ncbi:MAG: NAD-dependent epimerase/dehydratase family protein [Polymorphobacter sp.]
MNPILVTGSSGLIGAALVTALRAAGRPVIGVDCRAGADIVQRLAQEASGLDALLAGVSGVIHLAGVSRVVDGQRDPAACWRENVGLSAAIIAAIARAAATVADPGEQPRSAGAGGTARG